MFAKLPPLAPRKQPTVREQLQKLHGVEPSVRLKEFLSSFNTARTIDAKNFIEGVKQFIQIANSNPSDKSKQGRKAFFGNSYSGLHYNNGLVTFWNATNNRDKAVIDDVRALAPPAWTAVLQDGCCTLVYKGQQPAEALDKLIIGPSVIDCGAFAQLSLWFGIRYLLGNEQFNHYFGRAPFFITQYVYNKMVDNNNPQSGNPLFSFLSPLERTTIPTVGVKHIKNSPMYRLKHPGEIHGGENCIVIDGLYSVFDPSSTETQALKESDIVTFLRQMFNEWQTIYDKARIASYAANPTLIRNGKTNAQRLSEISACSYKTLTEEEFSKIKQDAVELSFDLHKLILWLKRMDSQKDVEAAYAAQPICATPMPPELLKKLEKNFPMDFAKFKQENLQQKRLMAISKQFYLSVMANESNLVTLSGKEIKGKTASALCASKELRRKNKKVVWISGLLLSGSTDETQFNSEIDNLIATNPDAIIFDDYKSDRFGTLLLEKLYSWYVNTPGKGLYITSNEPIVFNQCYGNKMGKPLYVFPPFNDYCSPQYVNWQQDTFAFASQAREYAVEALTNTTVLCVAAIQLIMNYITPTAGFWNAVCYQLSEPQKQVDKQVVRTTPMLSGLPAFFARKENYELEAFDESLTGLVLR